MSDEPCRIDLTRPQLLRLLDALDATTGDRALTLSIAPGDPPDAGDPALTDALDRLDLSETGGVVFWGDAVRVLIAPPFAMEAAGEWPELRTDALRELVARPRTLGVVLVRLGGYSVGVYRDGAFVDTKTGGRFVKNRHRKGGQSQRRFERIREGQIREHFDDVAEVIRTKLVPVAADLEAVVMGGDRRTVQALLKRASLPAPLAGKLHPRVLDVPEPRREVLERTPAQIWTSRAVIVRPPDGWQPPGRPG